MVELDQVKITQFNSFTDTLKENMADWKNETSNKIITIIILKH
jgi:phage-related tail protein